MILAIGWQQESENGFCDDFLNGSSKGCFGCVHFEHSCDGFGDGSCSGLGSPAELFAMGRMLE